MKCFPYNLQNKIEKANNKIYPILLYGSEGGLISSLIKETYKQIQKRFGVFDYVNIDYSDKSSENIIENVFNSPSLFTKKIFAVVKNPKENILSDLEKLK